ncbi:WD40 repeat-like protein [Westerdykella ornata]|uniref:WD40 repeat-like protein n=1 Tax=Westerdykella ornata TaxID=318751 RepID=A0A6A6JY18_WESOR|nr:WD40 repeat-like protein [Westerdykella ornata]KAF2281510.1 WD40 repeat-like protein [Westerdykella ornata]
MVNGTPQTSTTASLSKKERKRQAKAAATSAAAGKTPNGTPHETPKVKEHQQTPSVRNRKSDVQQGIAHKSEASVTKTREEEGLASQQHSTLAKPKSKNKKKSTSLYSMISMGPRFLRQDPVFTADEKHVILSDDKSLKVYEVETSTLAQSISKPSPFISAYALSASNTNQVYTASASGLISLWDWTLGKIIGRWDVGAHVRSISVVKDPATNMDLVFTHETSSRHNVINVHALRTREQGAPTELKEIYKRKRSNISGFQVLLSGKIVVVSVDKSILVGTRSESHKSALQEYVYVWREFQTSMRVTAFDAYVRTPSNPEGKASATKSRDHLDLVVGDQEGAILWFEDILASFARLEKSRKEGARSNTDLDMLRPKRLHWHREAVASVKWSRDGNYLISGGTETVLVLWQLSTGKQQHLPHLTAEIENIVTSPSGALYLVKLANTSVIALSTTELKPKMNIVGIQAQRVETGKISPQRDPEHDRTTLAKKVPMVVDPKDHNQVLFTVPSSQPSNEQGGDLHEPYLQTFGIARQQPLSSQALTRNNATDPNMAPDGKRIKEPDVQFMQISNDGRWLATVEEWMPPRADTDYLDEGLPDSYEKELLARREIYIKFWRWDEKNSQWVLESRIDFPQTHKNTAEYLKTPVQDLIADLSSPGFATVGQDHTVRIWRPKKTKDRSVTWFLKRSIEVPCNVGRPRFKWEVQWNCRLAMSSDGSLMAVGVSDGEFGVIHLINAFTGEIIHHVTTLNLAQISYLGIIHRHLIVAKPDGVSLYDVGKYENTPVERSGTIGELDASLVRFAINHETRTFAIAYPKWSSDNRIVGSTISIFDHSNPKPRWESTHPHFIRALCSTNGYEGYVALDSTGTLIVIRREASDLQITASYPDLRRRQMVDSSSSEPVSSSEEIEEAGEEHTGTEAIDTLATGDGLLPENDKPVVTAEQLAEAVGAGLPSHALPPVQDMFDAVFRLYSRKPRVSQQGS